MSLPRAASALFLSTALAGAVLSAPVAAGPLAPTRASDLVTLVTSGVACPKSGVAFDQRVLPDGTQVPFSIPDKRVLVVTSFAFVANGAPAGAVGTPTVNSQDATGTVAVFVGAATAGSNGAIAGQYTLPSGVAVAAGRSVCLNILTDPSGILHGFLAKDR